MPEVEVFKFGLVFNSNNNNNNNDLAMKTSLKFGCIIIIHLQDLVINLVMKF